MCNMFIQQNHLDIVKSILKTHLPDYQVMAFGSRVHGENLKESSDLDLAVMTKTRLPDMQLINVKEAFSESGLPFRVDVIDFATLKENFRKIIEQKYEIIHNPDTSDENKI